MAKNNSQPASPNVFSFYFEEKHVLGEGGPKKRVWFSDQNEHRLDLETVKHFLTQKLSVII